MIRFAYILLPLAFLLFLFSCGNDSATSEMSSEQLKVQELESEITELSKGQYTVEEMNSKRRELIEALDGLYHAKISDSISAQSLDKMHLSYSAMHDYVNAAHIADTLIFNYPDYPNRELVLESQANNYDMFILPRNKNKVKYYLELLLDEYPDMDEERKEGFEYRLQNIDLTMEELIMKQAGGSE